MAAFSSVFLILGSPQERFHLRCNQFHNWERLGMTRMVEAFFLLMTYYINESSSAKAGQGAFAIHPDLKSLFCELLPENLPYNSCPPPGEIVEYLRMSEDREKNVNMMAHREKSELYSPPGYQYPGMEEEAANTFHFSPGGLANNSAVRDTKFSFDRSLNEFGLPTSGPDWLSNGDILALTEDDPSGHVPSPAPGDSGTNNLHSPVRKLSIIPEVGSCLQEI